MKQTDRIKDYMMEHGSISTLEAMQELGCMRLASRIHDLKQEGCEIGDEWESKKNRYGEPVKFKRYTLLSLPRNGCRTLPSWVAA